MIDQINLNVFFLEHAISHREILSYKNLPKKKKQYMQSSFVGSTWAHLWSMTPFTLLTPHNHMLFLICLHVGIYLLSNFSCTAVSSIPLGIGRLDIHFLKAKEESVRTSHHSPSRAGSELWYYLIKHISTQKLKLIGERLIHVYWDISSLLLRPIT